MITSFIEVSKESDFPIQNLPYGAYKTEKGDIHLCSAIGEYIIDLQVLDDEGFFDGPNLKEKGVFLDSSLNYFMSLGCPAWKEARETLQMLLEKDNPELRDDEHLRQKVFIRQDSVEMVMPVQIGDFTDFYSSEQHARNVGAMFRDPENALLPNWKHLPVGYHGRASSVVISGTKVRRPKGQILPEEADTPVFEESKLVDFELEVGFLTGPGNELGQPIDVDKAEEHIFGLVLVNDWSARDIQKWEYQPLGPFLAKNWATSISPWIVTLDALEPFRIKAPTQNPRPLSYLDQKKRTTFDIQLEVFIKTEKQSAPYKICATNYNHLYWTIAQQLSHHTITGCNTKPGDLYGSGTISGNSKNSYGSMLELTWKGTKKLKLPSGEERTFLEDGDEIIMKAFSKSDTYRIGFGEVRGKIIP